MGFGVIYLLALDFWFVTGLVCLWWVWWFVYFQVGVCAAGRLRLVCVFGVVCVMVRCARLGFCDFEFV